MNDSPGTELLQRCAQMSAKTFLARLAFFCGGDLSLPEPNAQLTVERLSRELFAPAAVRKKFEVAIDGYAAEILHIFRTLEQAPPQPASAPTETLRVLATALRAAYTDAARALRETSTMVVPLDHRFPGFEMQLEAGILAIVPVPRGLPSLKVQLRDSNLGPVVGFRGNVVDAVELLALRRLIIELERPSSPLGHDACAHLEQPPWAKLLKQVAARHQPERGPKRAEVGFVITKVSARMSIGVLLRTAELGKALGSWRPMRLSILQEGALVLSELEREIGELLLATRSGALHETFIEPLTISGRAACIRLAKHPHVYSNAMGRHTFAIHTESLALIHGTGNEGALRLLFAQGVVPLELATLCSAPHASGDSAVAMLEEDSLRLCDVPVTLRPWLRAAAEHGESALTFPEQSKSSVLMALLPALGEGAASLPESLIGTPIPLEMEPALCIDWQHGAYAAEIELMISVSRLAPLLAPGSGPALMHFLANARPVFVRRDVSLEFRTIEPLRRALEPMAEWDSERMGRVSEGNSLLALLRFMDSNPDGIRIETRRGKAPKLAAWAGVSSRVSATHADRWFTLRGELRLGDTSIPLDDLLLAVRRNLQYVRFGEEGYVELTETLRQELAPLAYGALPEKGALKIHDGFTAALLLAQSHITLDTRLDIKAMAAQVERQGSVHYLPSIENGVLRDYQKVGVSWMLGLAGLVPGCMLADDMGLGKTVQTASVLRHRANLGPTLIVAPASVSFNWKVELGRFVPSLRVTWFNEERELDTNKLAAGDVVVVSFDLLRARPERFRRSWSTLVIDEVQFLKNHKAKRRDAVSALTRDFTIALSGTPVENHLGELWSVVSLCFPGLLGTESSFRARFQNPIESPKMGEEGGASARTAALVLGRLLRPFLLRRTREEVLSELPPREDITLYVELSKEERQRYEALRGALEKEFGKKKKSERGPAKERIQVLAAITRLRQLACDASVIDPTFTARSAKLETLKQISEELFRQKATVLVFSQFTSLLRKAEQTVQELGAKTMYLDGTTPLKTRRDIVRGFQEGNADFLFISLTAGGTGLNLTHASHVIHLDPWWNPAIEEQATSRAHRMGQTKAVTVYRLVARATLEERILLMHAKKRDLVSAVLSGKADPKPLSADELLSLFQEPEPWAPTA